MRPATLWLIAGPNGVGGKVAFVGELAGLPRELADAIRGQAAPGADGCALG